MEYEKLKNAAETVIMPEEMKGRIIRNCSMQILTSRKENVMNKGKYSSFLRKPIVAFAALAICFSMSVTALAEIGVLQGFFQDITNSYGAIVGTSYEQASDEINMSIAVIDNELNILATFENPQMAPYIYAKKLGIATYQIIDANGKVVKEGSVESSEVSDGQASVYIRLDGIDRGKYKLVVTAFVTEKKAEQPLNINGKWEGTFTK